MTMKNISTQICNSTFCITNLLVMQHTKSDILCVASALMFVFSLGKLIWSDFKMENEGEKC